MNCKDILGWLFIIAGIVLFFVFIFLPAIVLSILGESLIVITWSEIVWATCLTFFFFILSIIHS